MQNSTLYVDIKGLSEIEGNNGTFSGIANT